MIDYSNQNNEKLIFTELLQGGSLLNKLQKGELKSED